MYNLEDKIEMWMPKNKRGAVISLERYTLLVECIVSAIQSGGKGGITLHQLIEEVNIHLADAIKSNLNWYLLQVKQDLEARGVIKTMLHRGRTQYIRLNRRARVTHSSPNFLTKKQNEDKFALVP